MYRCYSAPANYRVVHLVILCLSFFVIYNVHILTCDSVFLDTVVIVVVMNTTILIHLMNPFLSVWLFWALGQQHQHRCLGEISLFLPSP